MEINLRAPHAIDAQFPRREADDMTVIMSILNMKGAWSFESPAPIEVTTATRFTSYFFIAAMTVAVPAYVSRRRRRGDARTHRL